jgi:hypothetical protein
MSSSEDRKLPWPPHPGSQPEENAEERNKEAVRSEAPKPADEAQPTPAEPTMESRAKFCPQCGTATSGAKFCPECGASTLIGAAAGSSVEARPADPAAEEDAEREVWRGAPDPLFSPVDAKTTTYTLTTERLRVDSGLVGKRHSQMELFRVKDVNVRRSLKHRTRGRGDLVVTSTDPSSPELKLEAIENPEEVAETMRGLVMAARQRMGITTREFM